MKRLAALFLVLTITLGSVPACAEQAEGAFSMVNTAAFSEQDSQRTSLDLERESAQVTIDFQREDRLGLTIGGTKIALHPVSGGLAGLTWDPQGASLLHESDVKALNDPRNPEEVPAWGADLAWPGLGVARLVLIPLGADAYVGFLISHPQGRKVVRQMEFRQIPGPRDRPD
nr:hypothetical protein [uncultured Roseibium sp.]